MEDYAAYLTEEAKSDIVALHQFRILWNHKGDRVHLFFEGDEDGLYYMPEIRRYLGSRLAHIYDCGGKKNVIDVREAIYCDGYDINSCLFFIDRDFDDFLGTQVALDERTYITDYYSIENYISSTESVRIILQDFIKLSMADPEFRRIEEALNVMTMKFYKEVCRLTAWILAVKEMGGKPNLNNTLGLKNIISVDCGKPTLTKAGFKNFKKKVSITGNLPAFSKILYWRRRLASESHKLWVRGKYDIWFFRISLLTELEEANKKRKLLDRKPLKIPSLLRDGHIFEMLGGRISPPQSLTQFLEAAFK